MSRQSEANKAFNDIGFDIADSIRKCVAKNGKDIDKVAEFMGIPSNSLVIDILLPQVVSIIFMAALKDDVAPENFVIYCEGFTDVIKKDIFKIRKIQLNKEV